MIQGTEVGEEDKGEQWDAITAEEEEAGAKAEAVRTREEGKVIRTTGGRTTVARRRMAVARHRTADAKRRSKIPKNKLPKRRMAPLPKRLRLSPPREVLRLEAPGGVEPSECYPFSPLAEIFIAVALESESRPAGNIILAATILIEGNTVGTRSRVLHGLKVVETKTKVPQQAVSEILQLSHGFLL